MWELHPRGCGQLSGQHIRDSLNNSGEVMCRVCDKHQVDIVNNARYKCTYSTNILHFEHTRDLLTHGVHAQRGLQYLICVCVCVCLLALI